MSSRCWLSIAALIWAAPAGVVRALPPPGDEPPGLRPCCPLGTDLGSRLGPLRTPLSFDNVASRDNLGQHHYAGRSALDERNGLVYACRAGFIDLGHLRSAADWTGYLFAVIRPRLGKPAEVPLQSEGADARLRFLAADVPAARRQAIALAAAQRVAFDLAVWHEIVTWYGDASVTTLYSELFSAFSPEDIYSDALGAELGLRAVRSALPYDTAASYELAALLAELGAASSDATHRALAAVANVWWNPHAVLPDRGLLLRRNLDVGPSVSPWRVAVMSEACAAHRSPHAAGVPTSDAWGTPLARYVVLELGVPAHADAKPANTAADLPSQPHAAPFTAAEIPSLMPAIALEVVAELGEAGTHPDDQRPPPPSQVAPPPSLADFQGIRLMQLEALGGALQPRRPLGFFGLRVIGGEAESVGGDVSLVRYSLYYDATTRGLVTHITGIQARALFFCEDRETHLTHGPILAWFADCDGRGWLGLGGSLGTLQHDGRTGRTITRPVELFLVANPLANALSVDYLAQHLNLFAGLSLDSVSPPQILRLPTREELFTRTPLLAEAERQVRDADVSLRVVAGAHLLLRSGDLRWEAQAHATARQDLAEDDDLGVETVLRLTHRFVLQDETAVGLGPMWGLFTVNLEGGWAYWLRPASSISDFAPPLLSANEKQTLWITLSVGFSYERFTL